MTSPLTGSANALKIYAPDVPYRVCAVPVPEGGLDDAGKHHLRRECFCHPSGAKTGWQLFTIKFCLRGRSVMIIFPSGVPFPQGDAGLIIQP